MASTRLTYSLFSQPYSVDKDDLIALLMPVWSTANFADAAHEINTDDKFPGKIGWDSDLSEPRFAAGGLAADTWELLADILAKPASAAITNPTATTTELADIADDINVLNKVAGKIVYNTTSSTLVYAVDATAGGLWNGVHDRLLDHTPV